MDGSTYSKDLRERVVAAVKELADERGLSVDHRWVREFVHAEGLSFKKRRWSPVSGNAPPAGGSNG